MIMRGKEFEIYSFPFEQMSSLKINFHKSELCCFGEAIEKQEVYNKILSFKIGGLPMKYLGILVDKKGY